MDGYAAYQLRSNKNDSVPGKPSSAIAENTNRWADETPPNDSWARVNQKALKMDLKNGPDDTYHPAQGNVPHPFAALRRGLRSEVTPAIMGDVLRSDIKLTGLCFSLEALQPTALFVVLVNMTHDELERRYKNVLGEEWAEGRICFTPARFQNLETQQVLGRTDWVASGQASLIRAIELITALQTEDDRNHKTYEQAFKSLRE